MNLKRITFINVVTENFQRLQLYIFVVLFFSTEPNELDLFRYDITQVFFVLLRYLERRSSEDT